MKQYKIKAGHKHANMLDVPIPSVIANNSFSYKYIIEADNCNFKKWGPGWAALCGVGTGLHQMNNSVRAVWRFNKKRKTFEHKIVREVRGSKIASDSLFGATCIATYDIEAKTFDIQVDGERATYNLRTMDDMNILICPMVLSIKPHFSDQPANADYTITKI